MKPSTTLALSALLALVSATPVEKRDPAQKTVTVTEMDIVTVDVYTTVDGSPPAQSSAPVLNKHVDHLAYHANNEAHAQNNYQPPAVSSSSSTPPPANPAPTATPSPVVQQPQVQAANVAPVASSSAAPVTGNSPVDIQNAENAKQDAVNQAQVNTNNQQKAADFAHQSSMGALQNGGGSGGSAPTQPAVQQPASPSPAAQSPAASPQAQTPSTSTTGGGGSCGSVGGSCSGDVTIYNDQGLGACGWNNDTNSEDFFALAAPMFGTYTNDSPGPHKNAYCGRSASIVVNGKSFNGMLTDRCGGCVGQSIDLSQHLFSQLYPNEPPGNGRYHNVQWSFTDQGPYNGPG